MQIVEISRRFYTLNSRITDGKWLKGIRFDGDCMIEWYGIGGVMLYSVEEL